MNACTTVVAHNTMQVQWKFYWASFPIQEVNVNRIWKHDSVPGVYLPYKKICLQQFPAISNNESYHV